MDYYILLAIGFIASLLLVLVLMPTYIKLLKSRNINQRVSEYALEEFKNKEVTPIMGGLMFVVIPVVIALIINPVIMGDSKLMFVIASYLLFFLVGFIDDLLIIVRDDNEGLSPKLKMLLQIVFAIALVVFFKDVIGDYIYIPLLDIRLSINPIILMIFVAFIFVAESNAVNFTDGMDGLCAGVSAICLIPFMILAFISKDYNIVFLIICVIGGLLGYLNYNFFPAKIFMGDSGSLALGALFTSIAVALKLELLLLIIGGVFLYEMVCVVAQQIAVRVFKRRIFKYTPIHYAFVIRGMKEKKVVILFYFLAIICSVVGLIIGVL